MLPEGDILLYGAGREARSTLAFLQQRAGNNRFFVTVDSGQADLEGAEEIAPAALAEAISQHRFALIVKSPGVSRYKPVFTLARETGIPVTSNLNLWGEAFRQGRQVVAVTGTKGKSTTATLTHLMLRASGSDAGLAGNVGVAPLDIADKHQTVVFELSSYQTADMDFLPDIAGVTNLYPEHVDWHEAVETYYRDKLNLISRPGKLQIALGKAAEANPTVLEAVGDRSRLLSPINDLVDPETLDEAIGRSRLKGTHNWDNARLAARLALAAGASVDGVLAGIAEFQPLPHRLEEHRFGRFRVVNDSISTTPEATKAALAAYRGQRLALIAGGHERQQNYGELVTRLDAEGVTTLVCLPVTGRRLAEAAARDCPHVLVLEAADLDEAMHSLVERADRFDTLILSPGAPSYNQFRNFEERGKAFLELAKLLGPETV
ncbi:UDP-N-acetylmuramoylalanine--D-glutamate ligase [Devosia pacifica]|uniref:UDP-N-acetylmuramoylalanine--D-glutamate ligase n=1 Tax=Devosia pacifica TaxID=1335967 RepID=A0A918RZY1_9HYPH|nr:UDP-N-acetylmuramoyl-L-alanine--D-glutamate ligase [Devosia pacifica]GHA17478.1 UDP-N-acetylmuramoylalanine--D-glutamate ligase [Devosia pacifica]